MVMLHNANEATLHVETIPFVLVQYDSSGLYILDKVYKIIHHMYGVKAGSSSDGIGTELSVSD